MQTYWRSIRFWWRLGLIATAVWFLYAWRMSSFDFESPMFKYVFLVPIVGWILIGVIIRDLRRRDRRH